MNVLFLIAEGQRERIIAECFSCGVHTHGDQVQILHVYNYLHQQEPLLFAPDIVVGIGIQSWARLLMGRTLLEKKHYLLIDKGYLGGPFGPRSKYLRCSFDALHPHRYFQIQQHPSDRLEALGVELQSYRPGKNILIVGGSDAYAQWHFFDSMGLWARNVWQMAQHYTDKPFVYRPKPRKCDTINPLSEIALSTLPVTIDQELETTWAVISYGSNVGVDALVRGVPNFVLGDGIVRSLATTNLEALTLDPPFLFSATDRWNFLANIAYTQFHLGEFQSGEAWGILKQQIATLEKLNG